MEKERHSFSEHWKRGAEALVCLAVLAAGVAIYCALSAYLILLLFSIWWTKSLEGDTLKIVATLMAILIGPAALSRIGEDVMPLFRWTPKPLSSEQGQTSPKDASQHQPPSPESSGAPN